MFSASPTSVADFFCSSEYSAVSASVFAAMYGRPVVAAAAAASGLAEVLQERLGAGLVVGVRRHAEPVDRRVDRARADGRVDLREGEEVQVLLVVRELLVDEGAEDVEPGLLALQRLRRLLPGAAQRVRLVVGQQLGPRLEHVLDLGGVPRLLARHQRDVVVEPVDAHVQHVERAHGGPAVLVPERDRRQVRGLHRVHQRDHLVEGRRLGPAVLLEGRLPVEDRPRVVALRDEVLLAVVAGRRLLEGVRDALERPHVTDVADQAGLGEEPHPEAGEPGEDVVGVALQVGVDVLLEGVVVDRVDLDVDAGRLLEVGGHRVALLGEGGAALVRAEADGAGGALGRAGAATLLVAAARDERAADAEGGAAEQERAQHGAAGDRGAGDGGRDEAGEVLGLGLRTGHDVSFDEDPGSAPGTKLNGTEQIRSVLTVTVAPRFPEVKGCHQTATVPTL